MNIVNIMNFVRGVEPRNPSLDLLEPVLGQIALNKRFGFENTFLLQYDAIIDKKFSDVFLAERDEKTELGVWIEIVRPLVEKVGIAWRGRPGYDWDWHVDPGFLPSYTYEQKTLLIDELMRKFREVFGEYPKSAGSWLLDIDSVRYMSEKYGVKAFGICREQLGVDAYTLWGGPYNQPYFPSKNNILCPASTKENELHAPVFRLLGIEPVRGYWETRYANDPKCGGCATMEPVWKYGQDKDYMRWFFECYFDKENLGIAYTQIGQENSFGWKAMKDGLAMQYELLREYADAGKVEVMKMCDAGEKFAETYEMTPPAALVAEEDAPINGKRYRSFWYTGKYYRANVMFDRDRLYFRDIQKYDEKLREPYLDAPCLDWKAEYYALPVVNERIWCTENDDADLEFEGKYEYLRTERDGGALVVYAKAEGSADETAIRLDEKCITVTGGETRLAWSFGSFDGATVNADGADFTFDGTNYRVGFAADSVATDGGKVEIKGKTIKLGMAE